jgi:ribosomal-protein-alanine N-acetyltransferase
MSLRGAGGFIGYAGHWRLMKQHLRSEIGYQMLPEHWGKGLMTEALRAILRFGFERMGLNSVEAQIDPANTRSRKTLERLGFLQDGLLRESYYFAGEYTDTAVFTLLQREYAGP